MGDCRDTRAMNYMGVSSQTPDARRQTPDAEACHLRWITVRVVLTGDWGLATGDSEHRRRRSSRLFASSPGGDQLSELFCQSAFSEV